jgi:hypothetical protein
MLLEFGDRGTGEGVVTVGDDVSLVSPGDGFDDFWMDAGIVVAGETAGDWFGGWWHRKN